MSCEEKQREWTEASFVDERRLWDALENGKRYSKEGVRDVLAKSMELRGLDLDEMAALLQVEDEDLVQEIFLTARKVKESIYGKRLVFFAPLYVSNYCANACSYCAYKCTNDYVRRRLDEEEIEREVEAITSMGHKRIALEAGEDPINCPIDYITKAMQTIYEAKPSKGEIRRINVNIAATTTSDYRRLKEAGTGTYVLFQETYHRETYKRLHRGPKADYDWHATAMDRAIAGGLDDLGIGVLFGLFDWKFDALALLMHSQYLDKRYGIGPHTISFPRLRPALGMSIEDFPYLVDDSSFKRIVASLRLAVPYTGMILSTREEPRFREEVIALGISQISAASRTGVGEYSSGEATHPEPDTPQFEVSDHRCLDEVIQSLLPQGYIPSFCTACYRSGRTGHAFMTLAKGAEIHNFCQVNAILTFQEYLRDHASETTRRMGTKVIEDALEDVFPESLRLECARRIDRIRNGESDLYF